MNQHNPSDRYNEWKTIIDEQEKSGKTQTEFCKERGLVLSQFTYYRGVIKEKSSGTKATGANLLSPIQVKKTELTSPTEIKIVLPNGFHCVIQSSIDTLHVKRLMEVLLSC